MKELGRATKDGLEILMTNFACGGLLLYSRAQEGTGGLQ